MFQKIKSITQNSFYQLLAVYVFLVLLISLNLFWKYSLQMSVFALVIAVLGIFIVSDYNKLRILESLEDKPKKFNKKLHYILFV